MSAFTGPLTITECDPDRRQWRLEQPLRYEVGCLGSGRIIEAPAGFLTDGASVPRLFWPLLPAWGRYSRAAVVHDFLCVAINAGAPHRFAPDRRTADRIFRHAMRVCGVSAVTRWLMWLAVRAEAVARGQ